MRAFLGFCIAILLSTGSANAEYPRPPLEAYGEMPMISSAAISPDGTKVAAIANSGESTRAIVIETGIGVTKQIGVEKSKARGISFYDNSHIILRASDTISTRGFRGEYEYTGAFVINIDSLDVSQLLARKRGLFPAQSGLGNIVGRAEKDGEVLMPAYVGERYTTPDLDLLVAELGTTRGATYMSGTYDTVDWFVGDGGRVLARER